MIEDGQAMLLDNVFVEVSAVSEAYGTVVGAFYSARLAWNRMQYIIRYMVGRDVTGQTVEVSAVSEAYGTIMGGLYSGRQG